MTTQQVISQIKKNIVPNKTETQSVNEVSQEIIQIVNEQSEKYGAELLIGGSVAKGTWLPGIHDIDCFLQFNYQKYRNKSESLSDITEKIVKRCFSKYQRLHGSRDYFQTTYQGYEIEIIPVLKIINPKMMKNITDVSPLHFTWLSKKTAKSGLQTDIRLTKQFFKANGLYGAESFIQGFSGHVIEVLIIHYGGFVKLLRHATRWKNTVIIDPESRYTDETQLMLLMNDSKLTSPLIVVDPIQPERNASAALSKEKYEKLKKIALKFLAKPNTNFFVEDKITAEKIRARKSKNKLILLTITPEAETTIDVAGCRILKQFEYITQLIRGFDFKIIRKNWYWDKHSEALLWFYVDPKKLSANFRHFGPPITVTEHAIAFRKQWSKYQVKQTNRKLYVDLPRKVRTVNEFLIELKKEQDLNIKIL
jgi:tRNA nucleotidyltransferase (CCA-adding enzyme)